MIWNSCYNFIYITRKPKAKKSKTDKIKEKEFKEKILVFPLFFYIPWIYYLPNYIYDIEFESISISFSFHAYIQILNWKLIEKEKTVCKVSYEKCYNHNFRTIFIGLWSLELESWREARLYLTFQGKFIQHDDSIKKKTNKKLHFWTLKS